jgi:hypothetical protein
LNGQNFLNESLAIRRALGERWGVAVTLGSLGWSALLQRDFIRMSDLLEESLMIRTEIGDQGGTAWCLEKLAEASFLIAERLSGPQKNQVLCQAAQIYGAAAAMRISINSVIDPADQPGYQAILANVRSAVGDEDFETAWGKGLACLYKKQSISLCLPYGLPVAQICLRKSHSDRKTRWAFPA